MKITDAVWEKRNLGVTCTELRVAYGESIADIAAEYSMIKEQQYMVVRIPSSEHDAVRFFQEKGYYFIEAAISLVNDMKSPVPDRLMRVCGKCGYAPMDSDDIANMFTEIDKNIFKTDRVYLDPHFTSGQAANRYKGWISDLMAAGNVPYKVIFGGEQIGFFINREKTHGVFDGILAAVYEQYEGTGMGLCVQYAGLALAREKQAKKYLGHISGNNPAVMRALFSLGFTVSEIEYVFVKHN